ncbi:MAG: CAAX prenyl protease-related protein [Betaproteobacteria bacterium]
MIHSKVSDFLGAPAAVRVIPFGVFIAFIMLAGAPQALLDVLPFDIRWIPVWRGVLVAVLLVLFWRSYRELHGHGSRPAAADLSLGALLGLLAFFLWINLDQPWMTMGAGPGFDPRQPDSGLIDWPLALLRLAGLALVVPVMEELFWRSFVMRWIDAHDFLELSPARVSLRAQLITAALFALEHQQWLAGFVAGYVYGWLYVRTGRLWVAVLAHAVTNGVLGAYILYTGEWRFW